MFSQSLQDAMNEQVKNEFYSAHVYLSMSSWFEAQSLPGFAKWMRVQYQEELTHGLKIFDFISDRDGRALVYGFDTPPADWKSPLNVFENSYAHEQKVTAMINNLYTLAVKENDYPTIVLLQWFINEQVEEDIADAYALPVFVGVAPGEYTVQVTLYNPETGQVYGQQALERVVIGADTQNVARELLGVNEIVLREMGGIQFVGYDLDTTEAFAPGARVPVTLLWRMPQAGMTREIEFSITDQLGKVIASQTASVGGDVQAGQYVRQELGVVLPETLSAGKYLAQVSVRGEMNLPFASDKMMLGTLEVRAP